MKGHLFTLLCAILLVVCIYSIIDQLKTKSKGILVKAKINGYTAQNGNRFAQYVIDHDGQYYTVSDAFAEEGESQEEYRDVLWVPGDTKYAYRPDKAKPQLWQIVGCIAAAVVIVIDILRTAGIA